MHPLDFLFSGARERVHWEQLGYWQWFTCQWFYVLQIFGYFQFFSYFPQLCSIISCSLFICMKFLFKRNSPSRKNWTITIFSEPVFRKLTFRTELKGNRRTEHKTLFWKFNNLRIIEKAFHVTLSFSKIFHMKLITLLSELLCKNLYLKRNLSKKVASK